MWLEVKTCILQCKMDVPLLWKTLPSLDKVFTGRSVRKKSTQVMDYSLSIITLTLHLCTGNRLTIHLDRNVLAPTVQGCENLGKSIGCRHFTPL